MNSLPPAEQIRIEATPLTPPSSVAGDIALVTTADPMTLRRFVAVTYANFRSLLTNWSQSSLIAMSTPANTNLPTDPRAVMKTVCLPNSLVLLPLSPPLVM